MEHHHFVDEELLSLVNHGNDVDSLVLENLREDENLYALEIFQENGITEVLRFENDNESVRRVRRRCIPNEDVDAQYKLFLENLREDGNSYAVEAVQEDGVPEVIRYHQDGASVRQIRRRCIPNADVDPQYKLFLENLREDGNSYAVEVVQEDGVPEVIRYHQDGASVRQIRKRCIPNADVDPQYKLFLDNLREDGNSYAVEVVQENGIPEVIKYHQDDAYMRRIRRRCIPNVDVDPQYKLFLENLREDGNSYAVEVVQEDGVSEVIRYHQDVDPKSNIGVMSVNECSGDVEEQTGDNIGVVSVVEDNGVVDPQSNIGVMSVNECSGDVEEQTGDNIGVVSVLEDNGIVDPQSNIGVMSVNECSGDVEEESGDNIGVMSVHEDNGVVNPQTNIGVMAVHEDNGVVDHQSNLFLVDPQSNIGVVSVHEDNSVGDPQTNFFVGNSREDRNADSEETGQESWVSKLRRQYHQDNGSPDASSFASTETLKNSRVTLDNLEDLPMRKSSVMKRNARDPNSVRASGLLRKKPRLEIPNNAEDPNSENPETLRSSKVKEKSGIKARDTMKLFDKPQKKKSSVVKRNAILETLVSFSGRTNVHSSKRSCLEDPNTPESFITSQLKEKTKTETSLRRFMKKEKGKMHQAGNSAQLLDEEETESQNTLRNRRSEASRSSKDLPEKKSLMVKKNVKVEAADPVSGRKKECLNKRSEALQSSKDLPKKKSSMVKNDMNVEAADQVSGRKKKRPNKRPGSQSLYPANSGRNHEADTESISDESYKKFQSSVEAEDGITIFTPPNGGRVTHGLENKEESEESSSDSDLIVPRGDPLDECRTPIIDLENGMASHNQFREGLMKCLKQPYDKTEHINLLVEWTRQRPASGHAKNLRNGAIKTYSLEGEYGKPYLEVYKDLAGTIKGSDRHSLILLRGFFYWLKNVAQEGSFMPWNDEECSKVLPSL